MSNEMWDEITYPYLYYNGTVLIVNYVFIRTGINSSPPSPSAFIM